MGDNLPFVSIVVPCLNEEKFVGRCLDSIIANNYPKEKYEILVVDGISEDGTVKIVDRYVNANRFIKRLDNPKKLPSCALNAGIKNAKGDLILWMSAHNVYEKDHISKCVKYLEEFNADAVGGMVKIAPKSNNFLGKFICMAISNPFGVGNSLHKIGTSGPKWADTAFGVCYKRENFKKIGFFNERLARGEDMEFAMRLKKAGLKTLLAPDIVSYYYARSDLRSFVKYNLKNGMWAILPFKYSDTPPVSLKHLVPLGFVLGLFGLLFLSFFFSIFWRIFLFIVLSYIIASLFFSFKIVLKEKDVRAVFVTPFIFFILHFTYGLGSFLGLINCTVSRQFWRRIINFERLFDIILSFVGLIILSPLFLIISMSVKSEDKGPVFYKGVRVGKDGMHFKMFKFRTMVVDADKIGGPSTSGDDPRLTKIGKFLRKYKLDEIPQFINVLKNDMSIVGPRPEVPLYVNMFTEEEKKILTVKPGMTDWASLWNSDEGAVLAGSPDPEKIYMENIRPKKLRLQLKYVKEKSFFTDLRIIFLTLLAIFKKESLEI